MNHPDLPAPPQPPSRAAPAAKAEPSGLVPAGFGIGLAMVLVLFDAATWIELNVAVVYGVPLVFAAAARRPRVLWTLAGALMAATFLVYLLQIPSARALPPGGYAGFLRMGDPYLVDRSLAALALFLTAAILHGWLLSLDAIELRDQAIEDNNRRLRQANEELRRQREEIIRQNRELERGRLQAEALSSRKTQLLAAISHDIRTPLHSISLMAEVMRRTAHAPAPEARLPVYAQRLQSHALAVTELLSEVMDLASFDSGHVPLHPSEFDIDALLQEQVQRLLPLAREKGLALELRAAGEQALLHTDKVKLGRIVGNLVSNAIKFTSEGTVSVGHAIADDGSVRIHVSDTGCGIRPENLERIFGDYCQEEHAAQRSGSGWGLGLAICRRLTHLLDGELTVESRVGVGSTFSVVLPASARAAGMLPPSPPSS